MRGAHVVKQALELGARIDASDANLSRVQSKTPSSSASLQPLASIPSMRAVRHRLLPQPRRGALLLLPTSGKPPPRPTDQSWTTCWG